MENKTPNPEKAISAAFDSVNLINKLITETADDKKKENVNRNVKHLELMMTKEFFTTALTNTQTTQIEECIAAGNIYTNSSTQDFSSIAVNLDVKTSK